MWITIILCNFDVNDFFVFRYIFYYIYLIESHWEHNLKWFKKCIVLFFGFKLKTNSTFRGIVLINGTWTFDVNMTPRNQLLWYGSLYLKLYRKIKEERKVYYNHLYFSHTLTFMSSATMCGFVNNCHQVFDIPQFCYIFKCHKITWLVNMIECWEIFICKLCAFVFGYKVAGINGGKKVFL